MTIENLNAKWYTTFWSHTYQSFEQIESPSSIGESALHALSIDWKRFVTAQTIDFFKHEVAILKSYMAVKSYGIDVDFIDMETPLDQYQVIIAPMLYMFRHSINDRLRNFVESGKTLIMSYWSGIVDENDLCFLGEVPYGLTDVFGLRREEFIGLYDDEVIELESGYKCNNFCEKLTTFQATSIYTYQKDYIKGTPAVTVNNYGKGKAYYVGGDFEQSFFNDFYKSCLSEA